MVGGEDVPKRPLGKTGLDVSMIGFGSSPLGGVYNNIKEEDGKAAVHEAFRLGINFFDTAPFYGDTRSELALGKALQGLPRDQIILATKVGRYGGDVFDFSAERVTASVHESLQRLQTPYIDIIQTHDIEFTHLDQIVNETLPALLKLKEQGLVRFIGITGLPLAIYPYVLDRVPPGTVDTILSYCHHTMFDKTLTRIIPYLKEKGVGIINASALSMGLLTRQGPPPWHPAPEEVKAACRAAAEKSAEMGVDLPSLAVPDALDNPDISTTLIGFSDPAQVRAAVEALRKAPTPQEEAALKEVRQILLPVQDTTWPSGLPENN
eukprot:jgi/Botrbrau1/4109/Bobra.152_3s0057.2